MGKMEMKQKRIENKKKNGKQKRFFMVKGIFLK